MVIENPSEKSAQTRDEMICPVCFQYSLEEHPRADEYRSEAQKLVNATYCVNPNCDKGLLTKEEVLQQYEKPSLIQRVTSNSISLKSILQGVILLGGVLFLLTMAFGLSIPGLNTSTPTEDVTVTGDIQTEESIEQLTILNNGSTDSVDISSTGFTVQTTSGKNVIRIIGNEEYATDTIPITVSEDGSVSIRTDSLYSAERYTITENTLVVERTQKQTIQNTQTVQDTTVEFGYNSVDNAAEIPLTISPLSTDQAIQETKLTSDAKKVTIPDETENQEITVTGNETTESITESYTYTGGSQTVRFGGNSDPRDISVSVSERSGYNVTTKSWNFNQSTTTQEFKVINQDATDFQLDISSNEETITNEVTGTTSDGTSSESIESSNSSITRVRLTGDPATETRTVSGTITDETITPDFEGTLAPSDVEVTFTGGSDTTTSIGSGEVSANASGGSQTNTQTLITDAESGEYKLELSSEVLQNDSLTEFGYMVDGEKNSVTSGSTTQQLTLQGGETVSVYTTAKEQRLESGSRSSNDVQITETDLQKDALNPGEDTGVRVFVSNPADEPKQFTATMFVDGNLKEEKPVQVPAETSDYEIVFDTRPQFDSEGVYSININDADPVPVVVGDASLNYGSGLISGTLSEINSTGSLTIDSNGSGEPDCEMQVNDSCSITAQSFSASVPVHTTNVENPTYEISYTARYGAEDITIQTNSETKTVTGELNETIIKEFSTTEGNTNITLESGNGADFGYTIEVVEPGLVENPTIEIDGTEISDPIDTFRESETILLQEIPSNTHTLSIETTNNADIDADLSWVDGSSSDFPELQINNTTVCSEESVETDNCTVSGINPGSNTIAFNGGNNNNFEYTISYTKVITPESVNIVVDDTVTETIERPHTTGEWEQTLSGTYLTNQESAVSLQSDEGNPTGTLAVEFETVPPINPAVVLSNSSGEIEYTVPESALSDDGTLQTEASFSIPQSDLSAGENTLYFKSENGGVYQAEYSIQTDIAD
jgi:hypothetical protein